MNTEGGSVFDRIEGYLRDYDFYRQFRAGALSREAFGRQLDAHAGELERRGLASQDLSFATRLPPDPRRFVDEALADLSERGVLATASYDQEAFEAHAERMATDFDHGGYSTYIYPEEARFLFALVDILRPRRMAFLGSYYGFWAFWALPCLVRHDGQATLIDIDPAVNRVAVRNLERFGYAAHAQVVTADAIDVVADAPDPFDLVVIDAETERDHPSPELRGKAIYTPLLKSSLRSLRPSGLAVFHNILLRHHRHDPFFEAVIRRNENEYAELLPLTASALEFFVDYPSTEGLGVGQRPRATGIAQ